MTKILKIVLLNIVLSTAITYAGGKTMTPANTDVIQVEEASSLYLGLGFAALNFHACGAGCTYEDKTYGAILRAGYDFNAYFGVEVRAIKTFWDKGPFGGVPMQHIGVFAKPQYALSQNLNLYGLLGYGYTENLGNGGRLNYFDHSSGFSAGIGIEYSLDGKEAINKKSELRRQKTWSLFLDYQRLLIRPGIPKMDLVTLGLRYNF